MTDPIKELAKDLAGIFHEHGRAHAELHVERAVRARLPAIMSHLLDGPAKDDTGTESPSKRRRLADCIRDVLRAAYPERVKHADLVKALHSYGYSSPDSVRATCRTMKDVVKPAHAFWVWHPEGATEGEDDA